MIFILITTYKRNINPHAQEQPSDLKEHWVLVVCRRARLSERRARRHGAREAAKLTEALCLDGREGADGALDDARAGAVRIGRADAGDETGGCRGNSGGAAGSRGRGRLSSGRVGSGGGLSSGSSSSGLGSSRSRGADGNRAGGGLVAGDGAAGSGAVLGNGHLLEQGLGLIGCGVDGKDHAEATVTLLSAVEPWRRGGGLLASTREEGDEMEEEERTKRSRDHHLHGHLGRRDDAVVFVGLKARVHAAGEELAGGGKGGLGDGVVLAQEGEDDHVADVGRDAVGLVDEALGAADGDGVRGEGAGGLGGGGRALRGGVGSGRGRGRGVGSTGGHGLRHGLHLVDGLGGAGGAAAVDPDDDDVLARAGDQAALSQEGSLGRGRGRIHRRQAAVVAALVARAAAVEPAGIAPDGVDVVDGLSERQRRQGQA